jgi:hypothetical protein
MIPIEPVIRHMILCDDVKPNPANPKKADITGLLHSIDVGPDESFPLLYPLLCVYIQFTGARGQGMFQLRISNEENDQVIYQSQAHPVSLGNYPLAVNSCLFRVWNRLFSAPGQFWVQILWNDKILKQELLIVR